MPKRSKKKYYLKNLAENKRTKNSKEYLKNLLSQYDLEQLLLYIACNSQKEQRDSKGNLQIGFDRHLIPDELKKSCIPGLTHVTIAPWLRMSLAYEAISGNNHGNEIIRSDEELIPLIIALINNEQQKRVNLIDKKRIELNGYDYFSQVGELFFYYNYHKVLWNLKRELYILLDVGPRIDKSFDSNKIIYNELGVNSLSLCAILLLLGFHFLSTDVKFSISEIKEELNYSNDISFQSVTKIIDHYSSTYDEIRNSPLQSNIFKIKPFVKANADSIFIIDALTSFQVVEHAPLWIIRDYYKKKDSQKFISQFGLFFESYVEELFLGLLGDNNFRKIEESEEKRADWELDINEYHFLIEQKSTFLPLFAKTQSGDKKAFGDFVERTIVEAIEQLYATEKALCKGTYIKIILLYEEFINPDMFEYIMTIKKTHVKNDGYYWIMTLYELETLLAVYQKNKRAFYSIINEKIELETKKIPEARNIEWLIGKRGLDDNTYLKQDKISKYYEMILEIEKELLE